MESEMTRRSRAREAAPLWGALLLAAAAWSLHLLIGQFLVEARCDQVAEAGGNGKGIVLTLVVATVVAAGLALLAAAIASGRRRRLARSEPGLEREAGLASVVSGLALFFVLLTIVEAVPLALLGCGGP